MAIFMKRLTIRLGAATVLAIAAALLAMAAKSATAAVVFRDASSSSASSSITTNVGTYAELSSCASATPSIPAGAVGDLLVAQVLTRQEAAVVTMPGWNTLFTDNIAGQNYRVFLFWRSATGTDPNTVTQTGTCNHLLARITRFGNVDTVQPLEAQPLPASNWVYSNAGDLDTGSQNVSVANSMLVLATYIANDRNVTQDPSFTQLYDTADATGNDAGMSLNFRFEATTGVKGPFLNMDLSGGGNDRNHGVLFAVRPAQPGVTITRPALTATADVMVASIAVTPSTVVLTPPAGWTLVRDTLHNAGGGDSHLLTYVKTVTAIGSEPSAYSWSVSAAHSGIVGGIVAFSGVETANPIVGSSELKEDGDTALIHTAPSISASAGDMLVTVHEYISSGTWTAPGGMTEAVDRFSAAAASANGISLSINHQLLAASGAAGTRAATASGNGDEGASQSLLLRPISLCYSDSFTGADNASPGSNWAVGFKTGSFGNPVIFNTSGNGRLRLTNNTNGVATWATLQRFFPAATNMVTVEFEHFAYGGSNADGIAVVLSDASIGAVAGAFGGSLGYAQKSNPGSDCTTVGGCPGFAGGWLGVALDEFGNYSAATEGRYGGGATRVQNSVAIRGSGTGMSGYRFLTGTGTLSPAIDGNNYSLPTNPHRYRITIDHRDGVHAYTSVERDTTGGGSAYSTLIGCAPGQTSGCTPLDVKDPGYSQNAVPTNFTLSFTGSTGAATNIHEIDNLTVCTAQPLLTPSLHHVKIEHGGTACTASATSITLKACADAACTSLYAGSVTVDLTNIAGATWSADPVTFTGGQTTITLTKATSGTVTLGATATSPTTGNATECYNGATQTCSLTFNTCVFDVIETGAAAGSPIYTKLAGSAFSLDVLSLAGASQTPTAVAVVDASSGTCDTFPVLQVSSTANTAIAAGARKAYSFTYNNATRNARVRVTTAGPVYSCSSDNFSIRPTAFGLASSASNAAATGTPVLKAGSEFFSITATATAANTYTGIPKLNSGLVTTGLGSLGTLSSFAFPVATAGVSVAGSPPSNGFTYSEVGNFNLAQYAVYDDSYAAVDSVKGECTSDFNNGPLVNGRFGCLFGSGAAGPFGRFIPHHFDTAVVPACGSFSYSGQAFAATITAKNFAGTTTANYAGSYAKTITFSDVNGNVGGFTPATLAGTAFTAGVAPANIAFAFTTKTTPPATLKLRAVDADSVSSASGAPTEGTTVLRSGRLWLGNAYGSDRLDLAVPFETQYWNGSAFVRNTLDSCTVLASANIALGNKQGGLATYTGPIAVSATSAGAGSITLTKPAAAAAGSVDLVAAIGAPGSPSNCAGLSGGVAASLAYLSGKWCGAAYDRDPTARATFGVFGSSLRKGPIYIRESY